MIKKLRGLGKGLYNFPGGKREDKETLEKCAKRETKEEVNLEVENLEKVAVITFILEDHVEEILHVFLAHKYYGEEKRTPEAIPIWFNIDSIPYGDMWEDDKIWVPKVLKGEKIACKFYFTKNWEKYLGGSCATL